MEDKLVHSKKIRQMTLEEKASLMSGANFWNTVGLDHHEIPAIMLTDGPHGLRKQGGKADHLGLNKSQPATCFPTAATLANSWNQELLYEVGKSLGKEAASESVSVLLGPGLNIKRNPLCGRNFEYFSEDPYLSGTLAASMIQGIQSQGVAACPKHFAVNSQEQHRMSVNEVVDDRALHEIYLEGFRIAVVHGKARSIMTSYNQVNGVYANENEILINDVLRNDWGFKGLVVTDWGGNNDRVAALKAGNHLEMPSTNGMTDRDIISATKLGDLEESVLDERVDEFISFVDSLKDLNTQAVDFDQQHEVAQRAASESIVLLKNEGAVLPLKADQRLGVIGVRESRRIVGKKQLNSMDVLSGAKQERPVAIGSYPIDVHSPDSAQMEFIEENIVRDYEIDLDMLLPVGISNLIVAGRAISATHEAHASSRVSVTCMAIGQSAGKIASFGKNFYEEYKL